MSKDSLQHSPKRRSVVKFLYDVLGPSLYERSQSHMPQYKKQAIKGMNLQLGNSVVVFGAGTGMELEHIVDGIGSTGSILLVDFSEPMLEVARDKVKQRGYQHIDFANANILNSETLRPHYNPGNFDAGISTLCLSLTDYPMVGFGNLIDAVKLGGSINISDVALASPGNVKYGLHHLVNAWAIIADSFFGNTPSRLSMMRNLFEKGMPSELDNYRLDVVTSSPFFGTFYMAWGTKPTE